METKISITALMEALEEVKRHQKFRCYANNPLFTPIIQRIEAIPETSADYPYGDFLITILYCKEGYVCVFGLKGEKAILFSS